MRHSKNQTASRATYHRPSAFCSNDLYYIIMYIYKFVYICTHIYVCIYIFLYVYIQKFRIFSFVHMFIHVYMCMCKHEYINIYTQAHTYTYMYTWTHTCIRVYKKKTIIFVQNGCILRCDVFSSIQLMTTRQISAMHSKENILPGINRRSNMITLNVCAHSHPKFREIWTNASVIWMICMYR